MAQNLFSAFFHLEKLFNFELSNADFLLYNVLLSLSYLIPLYLITLGNNHQFFIT